MRLLLLLLYVIAGGAAGAQSSERTLTAYLNLNVARNPIFASGTTGFYLYDIGAERSVYEYNGERYFVPASNVKLLTFYLALHELGAGTPAVFYRHNTDRIDVWGTGYPLLLHPSFIGYDALGPWLREQTLPLVFHQPETEAPPRYGAGWSWDDYDYGFVYERTALPVYGNRLYLDLLQTDGSAGIPQLYGSPPEVANGLIQDEGQDRAIRREERSNTFTVGRYFDNPDNFPLQRALITDTDFTQRQLRDAFAGQPILAGTTPLPPVGQRTPLTVALPDTVYRRLLQNSDNYLAEQLLLQSAAHRYGYFDEERLFDYATDTLFANLGLGEFRYADGSGLSRYNLVRPRQLAQLVTALYEEVGEERLLDLLPAGGGSGTLKRRFDNRAETYVYAKTGSLSGVMCISGLLRAKSGRWLAFSFLHNNVVGGTRGYYREMEEVLGEVYDQL